MAAGSHFGCPKITSYHFRSIPQFLFLWFFYKMAAGAHFRCPKFWPFQIDTEFFFGGHFGCPKITFDRISGQLIFDKMSAGDHHFWSHFWPFQIDTQFFLNLLTKWMGWQCQLSNSSEIFGWVMHVSSLKNVVKSFKSYRADNEIVTRRLPCWRKHNIPLNLRFSGIW